MRSTSIRILVLGIVVSFVAMHARSAESDTILDTPGVQIAKETTLDGRQAVRYEHDSLIGWKYAKPQKDYFYLVYPKSPAKEKVPLHVVLHSAGGSGESELPGGFKNHKLIQAYTDESSYGLYLDCGGNRATDWWWGQQTIRATPDTYKNELAPTEKRVLATVAWAIKTFNIDSNRVYLSGISMGGSGTLGIGLCHGDIFAAISVAVPAGVEHALLRMSNGKHADPPPLFDFSSQNDNWSKRQEELLAYCQTQHYAMAFAWGAFGHRADVSMFNAAVYESPWLSIRKDEAYPVFTNASTDNAYPGFQNLTAPDQAGQINGYFRWKNVTDSPEKFAVELRLVRKNELNTPLEIPPMATADVTLRRLQRFQTNPGKTYRWRMVSEGKLLESGTVKPDESGLLVIPKVKIIDVPGQLEIELE